MSKRVHKVTSYKSFIAPIIAASLLLSCGEDEKSPRNEGAPSNNRSGTKEGEREAGPFLGGGDSVYVGFLSLNDDPRFKALVDAGLDIEVEGGFIKKEELEGHLVRLELLIPLLEDRSEHIDQLTLGVSPKFQAEGGKSKLTVSSGELVQSSLDEVLVLHDRFIALEMKLEPIQIIFDIQTIEQVEHGLQLIESGLNEATRLADRVDFLKAGLLNTFEFEKSTAHFQVIRQSDQSEFIFQKHMRHVHEELEIRNRFSEFEFVSLTKETNAYFRVESEFLKGLKEFAASEQQAKELARFFKTVEIKTSVFDVYNANQLNFETQTLSFAVGRSTLETEEYSRNFFKLALSLANLADQWGGVVVDTSKLTFDLQLPAVENQMKALVNEVNDTHQQVQRILILNDFNKVAFDASSKTLQFSSYDSVEDILGVLEK